MSKKLRFKNRPIVTVNKTSVYKDLKHDLGVGLHKFAGKLPVLQKYGYNTITFIVNIIVLFANGLFNIKTFFVLLALALASIDVVFSASSFTATYRSLGDYALYIVIIFVMAEFGAMKLLLTPMPYRPIPKP